MNDGRLAALLVSTALTAPLTLGVSQGWAQVAATGDVSPSPAVSPVWNTPSLLVGDTGSGSVTITAGGQVSSDRADIGANAGSTGSVSVDGAGATWTNADTLIVGKAGNGTLTVSNGGQVSSHNGYLATDGGRGEVTVAGSGSTLSIADSLRIGETGSGTLIITDGGQVSNDQGALMNGDVLVRGAGSAWNTIGALFIASSGGGAPQTAALTVSSDGRVSSEQGQIGLASGATAAVFVDGVGSRWSMSSRLFVGMRGQGTLSVTDGAAVDADGVTTMGVEGGSGLITVDGPGSTLTSLGTVFVAEAGAGALAITRGGAVVNQDGVLGLAVGAHGVATVSGAGSSWTNTARMIVGYLGDGQLSIADGGQVSNGNGVVGDQAGSTGMVSVDGAGSSWTNAGGLVVGYLGEGRLSIADGGYVESASGEIAYESGSNSAVLVDGAGSAWEIGGDLEVGGAGDGALTVTRGAVVMDRDGVLGAEAGAHGVATVSGAGSLWTNASEMIVGDFGEGRLSITDGGRVVSSLGEMAYETGSTGDVLVDGAGSAWEIGDRLVVGDLGDAVLTVSNGGVVSSGESIIGLGGGATGAVVVDGAGSKWSLSDRLFVGLDGQGTLSITNGAAVDADNITTAGVDGGWSLVSVDGPGSTLTSVQDVFVAERGDGTLTITRGATVVNQNGALAVDLDARAVATVSGAGSSWTNAGVMVVGYLGDGRLSIADGGRVVSAQGEIGYETGSTGDVLVDGAGSAWEIGDAVTVGNLGDGALTVSNGGVVSVNAGAGSLNLGHDGGRGVLNIGAKADAATAASGDLLARAVVFGPGSGEINFNHSNPTYTFAAAVSGDGVINQWAGRTILTGDSSGFGGVTTVSGGVLAVNGELGGALSVLAGGRLQGSGAVGTLAVAGTVAPGNSIGTLTVNGAFSQAAGSTYQLELTTAGLSDRINVAGTATIASGATLNVVKTDAAAYVPGTRYTVLTATDGVIGTYTLTGDLELGHFTSLGAAYDSNAVYLEVIKARTFSSTGLSFNQIRVGAGLDSLALSSPLIAALLALPDDAAAQGAFDQLSGASQVSTKAVLVEDSRFPREAAVNRLRSAFGDVGAAPALAIDPEGVTVWGDAFGGWGTFDGDADASTLDRDLGGLIFGVDASAFGGWRVGLMGGYSHAKYKAHDHRQTGASDDYHLGVYGGRQWGPIALRTGAAFSWHELDARRTVAFPGFTDALESDNSAFTAQAFGEVGYRLDLGRRAAATVSLEPFANLAYVDLDADGFTEKGGVAALSTQGDNTGAAFTTLGLRAASTFDLDNDRTVTARGALGWKHAFGDRTPTSTVAFGGGAAFTVAGLPIDADAVVVEAGLDAGVSSTARLSLSYGAQFAGQSTDQTVRGGFSVRF